MPNKEWQFVNFDNAPEAQDEASRRLIRITAMRAFRRKERQQRVETFQKAKIVPQPISYINAVGSFQTGDSRTIRTTVSDLGPRPSGPMPSHYVLDRALAGPDNNTNENSKFEIFQSDLDALELSDPRSIDPTGTQSMGLKPSQHFLLNHFISVIAPVPFRFTAKKEETPLGSSWIHRVLQDRIILEATLLTAAGHLDRLHKRESTPLTLRHRVETIRMVNQTLDSSERASDSNIGAVALLAFSGNRNLAEMRMHMDALVALVRLRGGLEFLGFGGILQMLISRLDLIFSGLTMSESKFTFSGIEVLSKDNATPRALQSNPRLLEGLQPFLGDIPAIFGEIRALTAMQDQFSKEKFPNASSIVFFGKKRSLVCHRLMSCEAPVEQTEDNHAARALFEHCQITGLIFMEYLLGGSHPRADILQSLESKLMRSTQIALERPGLEQAWDDDPFCARIILWVYFIGGLTASNTVKMQWYASSISRSMRRLHLKTWQELKACLEDMIWTEQLYDQAFERLWEGILTTLKNHS